VMTTQKNLIAGASKNGAHVGYKDVTVYQQGNLEHNGKTEYTYTSPTDFPEITPSLAIPDHPYLLTRNLDYKRGKLLKEKKYSLKEGGTIFAPQYNLLSESHYSYDYEEYTFLSGVKIFSHEDCPAVTLYP